MPTFRVTAPFQAVEINETALTTEVAPILRRVHTRLVRASTDNARVAAPVDTGALKASIRPDTAVRDEGLVISGGYTAHARYAWFVHGGTRPHPIRPVTASTLTFFWPKAGRVVFFKHVMHPGTRPNPFMMDAALKAAASDPDIQH